jgi:integrase
MQDERSTRRRVRIAENLYERPGKRRGQRRYEVGYADVDGRWRMKTLKAVNRTEARAERDEFLSKLRRGEIARPSKITFGEVASEFLTSFAALVAAGDRAERTLERYRSALDLHVVPVLGTRPIQKITADQLAALISSSRTSKLAPWTIRGIITPMRRVFALAVRRGYIAENPVLRLHHDELPRGRAQSEPRTLAAGEVQRLLASSPGRYRPLLAVAVFTGMRIQEILGLVWDDVDFRERVIRVRAQLSRGTKANPPRRVDLKTKAGRREIALARELEPYLREHLRATELATGLPRGDAYVFATSSGKPLNRNNAAKRGLDNAAKAAGLNREGVPKLGFHDLRHTFASHLIRAGIDPVRASRQLGHARPSITLDVYAHEFDRARSLDDVRDSIDAAFGEGGI